MDDTRRDHGLKVTGEGQGLVGHAGAVLLRPPASQLPLPKTGTTRLVTDLAGTLNHRG
jgi:hypothetical protein